MNIQFVDPFLVLVLLLNFFLLVVSRMRPMITAVAVQGILLGVIYPIAHQGLHAAASPEESVMDARLSFVRLLLLTFAMISIKGIVIPRLLFRAVREVKIGHQVESLIGFVPTLLIGAVGTGLSIVFAQTLPLTTEHTSLLIVPASLATVFTGFLILTTRRVVLTQVLGYLVLENGIFIFGLLLVEAMPSLVEVGVLLDLFVGVFVMGIIIYHVSREFPAASSEHLSALRE